jgi:hypothetical protein
MEQHVISPETPGAKTLYASPSTVPAVRHDGWTGDKMATFCETLAETGVVAQACDAARMGISGAYAARRRDPVFAGSWEAALTIARERLADTLLARSIEGNVEQIYRDGELVGERHVIDNRLGLAILRRLDRLAETGMTLSTRGERFVTVSRHPASAPACHPRALDWDLALTALRTGNDGAIAAALAMFRGNEVEEVEDPSVSLSDGDSDEDDLSDRCWCDDDGVWMTIFPPPPDFTGWQEDDPGAFGYERECTLEEAELLEANDVAAKAEERSADEDLRDSWFAMLREELQTQLVNIDEGGSEPPPATGPA